MVVIVVIIVRVVLVVICNLARYVFMSSARLGSRICSGSLQLRPDADMKRRWALKQQTPDWYVRCCSSAADARTSTGKEGPHVSTARTVATAPCEMQTPFCSTACLDAIGMGDIDSDREDGHHHIREPPPSHMGGEASSGSTTHSRTFVPRAAVAPVAVPPRPPPASESVAPSEPVSASTTHCLTIVPRAAVGQVAVPQRPPGPSESVPPSEPLSGSTTHCLTIVTRAAVAPVEVPQLSPRHEEFLAKLLKVARGAGRFYIGVCEQPDERWNGRPGEYPGHCEQYDTMDVLGECTSQAECMGVERILIARAKRKFPLLCQNIGKGGERVSRTGPWHIYIVSCSSAGTGGLLRWKGGSSKRPRGSYHLEPLLD